MKNLIYTITLIIITFSGLQSCKSVEDTPKSNETINKESTVKPEPINNIEDKVVIEHHVDYNFHLTEIEDKSTIDFNDIFHKYHLNPNLPSILITWSNKWCKKSCTNLINRYAACDTSMFNLIIVNIDSTNTGAGYKNEELLYTDLKNSQKKWSNAACFYGFNDKANIKDVSPESCSRTPYLVCFNDSLQVIYAKSSTKFYPNLIFDQLYNLDVDKICKNSPEDGLDHVYGPNLSENLSDVEINKYLRVLNEIELHLLSKNYLTNYFNIPEHLTNTIFVKLCIMKGDLYCKLTKRYLNDSEGKKGGYYLEEAVDAISYAESFYGKIPNEDRSYIHQDLKKHLDKVHDVLTRLEEESLDDGW